MKALRVGLYCVLGGLPLTISAAGAGHFGWWWLSGIVLAGAFVPVALFGPRSFLAQWGVAFLPLWVAGSVGTMWEAAIFLPGQKQLVGRDVAGAFVLYLIFTFILAVLAKILQLTRSAESTPELRPAGIVAALVVVSGIAYVVYYLIFGGIAYTFFTKQYYPGVQAVAESLGLRLWLIEIARGVLMTLAVLPAIYTLRMPRWAAAVSIGILLWIAGGGAQLLVPNLLMVPAQRYIHIIEILTQNALLGITAVVLLRKK
jgi:hypothetical protein